MSIDESKVQSWYPNQPPSHAQEQSTTTLTTGKETVDVDEANRIQDLCNRIIPTSISLPPAHEIWTEGTLKYTVSNKWQSVDQSKREACRRHRIHGVEIRKLESNHFLHGQYGLFATQKFSKFDIIGEYTGKIVDCDVSGHYVAALEDKGNDDSLGIDAEIHGNELRFVNSYLNVAFKPNVTMRTVYVNTYPHIVIVCCEDIDIGDEFLLDYGEAYTKMFLTPQPKGDNIPTSIFRNALPGYGSDSSRHSSDHEDNDESVQSER